MEKQKGRSYARLYMGMVLLCVVALVIGIYISKGDAIANYFFRDRTDTGNDFFNCIPAVKGNGLGYSLVEMYPPLAKMIFLMAAHIYVEPMETAMRNSLTDPRMFQSALATFLFCVMGITLMIVAIAYKFFEKKRYALWIAISVVCAYSVLFAIERGNIIYLSFAALLFFAVFYKSENRILRELALLALAFSAGIKLYPAAFGVILLYERRWKEALRTIVYGILAVVVPYVVIYKQLPEQNASNDVASVGQWGMNLINGLIAQKSTAVIIYMIIAVVMSVIGIVVVGGRTNKPWIRFWYASVAAMICGVQFQYSYTYMFFIPALLYFLRDEEMNLKNTIYFIGLCLLNLPLPIFGQMQTYTLSVLGAVEMYTLFTVMLLFPIMEFFSEVIVKKKSR